MSGTSSFPRDVTGRSIARRLRRSELKNRTAVLALLAERSALKNGPSPFSVALRAYEVRWLVGVVRAFQAVDKVTGLRLVKLVAPKLCFKILGATKFILDHQHLRLEQTIAETRVLYCQKNLIDGGFDFRIAGALRRLHKSLEAGRYINDPLNRTGYGIGPIGQAVHELERGVQDYFSKRGSAFLAWDDVLGGATDSTSTKGGAA